MVSKISRLAVFAAGMIMAGSLLAGCLFDSSVRLTDIERSFEEETFSSIKVDTNWGDVKILATSDESASVVARDVPDTMVCEIINDVLTVDFNLKKGLKPSGAETSIVIKVPKKEYSKLILDFGAGNVNIEKLWAGTFDIDCGAGSLFVSEANVFTELKLEGGAGSIKILDSELESLRADLGAGSFFFGGTMYGNINLECGAGKVELALTNPESDFVGSSAKYSIKVDRGVGSYSVTYNN